MVAISLTCSSVSGKPWHAVSTKNWTKAFSASGGKRWHFRPSSCLDGCPLAWCPSVVCGTLSSKVIWVIFGFLPNSVSSCTFFKASSSLSCVSLFFAFFSAVSRDAIDFGWGMLVGMEWEDTVTLWQKVRQGKSKFLGHTDVWGANTKWGIQVPHCTVYIV